MLLKSFFGYTKPSFSYELVSSALSQPVDIAVPGCATLLLPGEIGTSFSETITVGARVKTGQLLRWKGVSGPSVVSSVTGAIRSIATRLGDYGTKHIAIEIAPIEADEWDDRFSQIIGEPDLQCLIDYFCSAPGGATLTALANPNKPIHTIVIYGGDTDLLIETNLTVLKSQTEQINHGIRLLKQATGIDHVVVVVPKEGFQNYDGHFEAQVQSYDNTYPGGLPLMVLYQLTGRMPQQGQSIEDLGVLFIRAEALAAMGRAFSDGRIPMDKLISVLDKQGRKRLVSTRIGTPIGAILKTLGIALNDRDRIICGGPMTGRAAYSEDQPVAPDTDALMVQDRASIAFSSDYPCINCGECVRVCPSKIQVHMLERFLEAGKYQDGADLYDLYACVECGLCSLVCVSHIPILQYIKLAKYELARTIPVEEAND